MTSSSDQKPTTVTLPAGTHWLCTCEQSKNYPHCDGSHTGTTFTPKQVKLDAPTTVDLSH